VDAESLTARLLELKRTNPEVAIVIRPDRELPVQKLVTLMDSLQRAQITRVGIATKSRSEVKMRRDARFWRNVALITLVHIAALIALLRWVGASKIESAQEITWLSADEDTSASIDSPKPEETQTTGKARSAGRKSIRACAGEKRDPASDRDSSSNSVREHYSEAVAKASPSPKKKTSPKPSPSPEKRNLSPGDIRKREGKHQKVSGQKKNDAKKSEKKSGETTAKNGGAAGGRAQGERQFHFSKRRLYGNMLHDRFIANGPQPTTVVASGAKLLPWQESESNKTAAFPISKLCGLPGNVVVDESVQAFGKKVTRVDALSD